jgi:hypothetical protein
MGIKLLGGRVICDTKRMERNGWVAMAYGKKRN